ncbi:alpha-1,2-mannosyltransferase [Lentzea xinjiangensis]|uniref:Alpha-1,2-mannosyltransferase n=1 Tax=Lentzea xinjiangensis TaxID=402600 RepID=A0A1H9G5N5_9PSEU|nr:glycosyltransferase 87 family protein [Lentzea xinjiangensis]SEQ45343.1 alpha-1,2-mannosyltransferase [Lentzea xinjiangensis]
MQPDRTTKLVVVAWAAVMVATLVHVLLRPPGWSLDLRVYRNGGAALLQDIPLYAEGFAKSLGGPDLPFTYPPIAAVLFSLLAIVPLGVAIFAVAVANLAMLTGLCLIAAHRVLGRGPEAVRWGLGAAAVSSIFDPLRETLWFGQINLLLGVLVMADCLLERTRWWPRGALIGLAAAIKLTPAFFALYFVARRQWKPVFVSIGSFFFFVLLGFVISFADAKEYWTHALLDPSRVGRLTYASNQALRGTLARFGLENGAQVAVWLGLSLLVVGLVWWLAARRGLGDVEAFLVVALGGLLISPVSWGHHWIWIAPALVLLARPALRRLWASWVVVAVFAAGPHWLFPRDNDVERDWNWWQQVVGNLYVITGVAVLVTLAVLAVRERRRTASAAG